MLPLFNITKNGWSGTVVHACNPNYIGGRDQEDCSSEASPGKKLCQPMTDYGGTHLSSQLPGKHK
jgi:hypothetical protein